MPNNFLGTHNDLDILHCTKKIILTNYFIIKSTKLSKNDYFKGLFMQFGAAKSKSQKVISYSADRK